MTKIANAALLAVLLALPSAVRAEDGAAKPESGPCKADVQKFCKDVTPGGGRVAACLKAYEDKISPECKEHGQQLKAQMRQAREQFEKACDQDRQKLCADAKPGRGMMACFKEHEKDLSDSCRAMIEQHKEQFAKNHPGMMKAAHACRADEKKFCADVKPGGGRVMDCLNSHQADLSPDCQKMMQRWSQRHGAQGEKGGQGQPDQGGGGQQQ